MLKLVPWLDSVQGGGKLKELVPKAHKVACQIMVVKPWSFAVVKGAPWGLMGVCCLETLYTFTYNVYIYISIYVYIYVCIYIQYINRYNILSCQEPNPHQ